MVVVLATSGLCVLRACMLQLAVCGMLCGRRSPGSHHGLTSTGAGLLGQALDSPGVAVTTASCRAFMQLCIPVVRSNQHCRHAKGRSSPPSCRAYRQIAALAMQQSAGLDAEDAAAVVPAPLRKLVASGLRHVWMPFDQ